MSVVREIMQLDAQRDWLEGGTNHDEDLHFSTYYLRASLADVSGTGFPGYSIIVANYLGFREQYFLRRSECVSVAQAIVQRALRERGWLSDIIGNIVAESDGLAEVFQESLHDHELFSLSIQDLLELYHRHDQQHRNLYRYARLPEALDRGVQWFTKYLLQYLSQAGLAHSEVRKTFHALTEPRSPSVLADEVREFAEIVDMARSNLDATTRIGATPRLSRMLLTAELIDRLEAHGHRWRYLGYHGYGNRRPLSLQDYVERLTTTLLRSEYSRPSTALRVEGRQDELFDALGVDDGHRELFLLYPEIAAAKLYRRVIQLRNFYFLDKLLDAIARRLRVPEWVIRCMTPEEVEEHLRAGATPSTRFFERERECLYVLSVGPGERILTGRAASQGARDLRASLHIERSSTRGTRLVGTPASPGSAQGICRVIIRANEGPPFEPGDILISSAADPDLLPCIQEAKAVVTEQGGVTSHASLICRELGVPTVVGVEGLLELVGDGDVILVDGDAGEVELIRSSGGAISASLGRTVIHDTSQLGPSQLGLKAWNLQVAQAAGAKVPPFVILDFSHFAELISSGREADREELVAWIYTRLNLRDEAAGVIIRSSSTLEDRVASSLAGQFASLVVPRKEDFWMLALSFVAENSARTEQLVGDRTAYSGSVIVQRHSEEELAGVCFTVDPRTHQSHLIIEWLPLTTRGVTGGHARPKRLVVDRQAGDVLEDTATQEPYEGATVSTCLHAVMEECLRLEGVFGHAIDVEWACAPSGVVEILQVRPVS